MTHLVRRVHSLLALTILVGACTPAAPPAPTVDIQGTVTAQVQATLAATPLAAPTPTPASPTPQSEPTPSLVATQSAAPTPTPTAAMLSEADVAARARTWLVRITRGSSIGSGVIVSPE